MHLSIRQIFKLQTDPFDNDLVRVMEKMPGVEEVEGRRTIQIRARRGDENWQSLSLVGVSDFSGNINHLDPIEGTQFAGENEVLISQDMMHITGFQIGDKIEIELPDGSNHDLNRGGACHRSNHCQARPRLNQ